MPWIQLSLNTSPDQASVIEDLLLAVGAVSVTFVDNQDQPVFEPERGTTPLWQSTRITGLFEADADIQAAEEELRLLFTAETGAMLPDIRSEILEDRAWEREWMSQYKPMHFGERLWICPSWSEPPQPDAVNLMLDPGLAFGTGTHPTTALCLRWLDKHISQGQTLIDYGCGSGILAIAGLLLGAKQASGVDNDPQALLATRDNLKRNGLPESALPVFLPEAFPDTQSDIVIANILAQPLMELAPRIASLVKPGGLLAMSGILEQQIEEVSAKYREVIDFEPALTDDGWALIWGRRK